MKLRLAAGLIAVTTVAAAVPLSNRRSEIVQVVEKVAPAVVNISAEQTLRRRPSLLLRGDSPKFPEVHFAR